MEFRLINTSQHVKSHNPNYLDIIKNINVDYVSEEELICINVPEEQQFGFNSFILDFIGNESNNFEAIYPYSKAGLFIDNVYLEYQSVKALNIFKVYPVNICENKVIFKVIEGRYV